MEAYANLDELHLVGQAEVQQVELLEKEASEVEEEEGSNELSEMSGSQELPRKMKGRKKMARHYRQTSENKWPVLPRSHLNNKKKY